MRTHSRFDMALMSGAIVLVAAPSVTTMAAQSHADAFLTRDEVTQLVSGNTIHFEVSGQGELAAFLDSDGRVTRMHKGQALNGVWLVKDDGSLCVQYAGNDERCGRVERNSDGTFTRVDDANATNHWTKISQGKDL